MVELGLTVSYYIDLYTNSYTNTITQITYTASPERDKARRGTVKNSEGSKLPGSGERNSQQPPYWVPGSVGYVRGNTALPLYYSGADIIQVI